MITANDNDMLKFKGIKKNTSGIYKIYSESNPFKIYIGSSSNLWIRFRSHKNHLNRNSHRNSIIQNHFNKYSSDLVFEVLSECPIEHLIELEQLILDEYRNSFFYNVMNINLECERGRSGMKQSESAKHKLSIANKGKKLSEEHKMKIRKACEGINIGRKFKNETILRMSFSAMKPIIQFNLENQEIARFQGIKIASIDTGINIGAISDSVNGKQRKNLNYIFKMV